ncbi:hypothetical protein ACCUM_1823 [Candidatus Accumulibacter phosphatis]|uniref:Uncharacterized protein n=1 Tax=Candidatus Accumulibacter phosphatis TaxID=327160 RepID=A0A5S4ES61_9PROT|nr:hypothetical protein ACCUM_1823 [Candidatus Accumulibacter phosphatis]
MIPRLARVGVVALPSWEGDEFRSFPEFFGISASNCPARRSVRLMDFVDFPG